MEGRCLCRLELDASKGIPLKMLQTRSYRIEKRYSHLALDGYSRDMNSLRDLVTPDFYQRVGYFEYYLVRQNQSGEIIYALPEARSGILGDRDLLSRCRPGDKIVAEWAF